MLYFTADLHFGHEKIIKHVGRPFQSVEEMDSKLIRNWNQVIKPEDEVYILGDFTMKGPKFAAEILRQLNGRKYLIRGNHDKFADRQEFSQDLFEWVRDYSELTWNNYKFILFHYPILEWNEYFRGSINLHGHQHNHEEYNLENRKNRIYRYDVGVDANKMRPVSIEQIMKQFDFI